MRAHAANWLPREVYFPHTSERDAERVKPGRLAIAGFVDTDIFLPAGLQAKLGCDSLWPRPLLLLDGQPKNVAGNSTYRRIEYFTLGLNFLDEKWVLRSGWDNQVVVAESQSPYLWSSGEGNTAAYLFPGRTPLRYNSRRFERTVSDVLRTIQSVEHIGRIGLGPRASELEI